jgi:hypothetical protein
VESEFLVLHEDRNRLRTKKDKSMAPDLGEIVGRDKRHQDIIALQTDIHVGLRRLLVELHPVVAIEGKSQWRNARGRTRATASKSVPEKPISKRGLSAWTVSIASADFDSTFFTHECKHFKQLSAAILLFVIRN